MEVTQKNLIFYAGCGITKDSKPLSEWEETNHKINVMFSLLKSKSST
jgi:isochorismate synthase EntC